MLHLDDKGRKGEEGRNQSTPNRPQIWDMLEWFELNKSLQMMRDAVFFLGGHCTLAVLS